MDDFAGFTDRFIVEIDAYLRIEAAGEYVFRLISDDGSRLTIDGKLIVLNDGLHAATPKDGSVVV